MSKKRGPKQSNGEKDEQKNTHDQKQWGETVKEKKRRSDGLAFHKHKHKHYLKACEPKFTP